MKKFLSTAIALLVAISGFTFPVSADFTADGVNADSWKGWSSADASSTITTEEIENRGTVVEVNGRAIYDSATSFRGVVMLTLDAYAPNGGIVSLEDASGNCAGSFTLADGKISGTEIAYDTDSWNTFKIFAMTGTRTYEIYAVTTEGDNRVLSGSQSGTCILPGRVMFEGNGLQIDNIKLEEMKKESAYLSSELNNIYTSDFSTLADGTAIGGNEGWAVDNADDSNYMHQATTFEGKKVLKMEKANLVSKQHQLRKTLNVQETVVIDMKLYEDTTYDTMYDSNDDGVADKAAGRVPLVMGLRCKDSKGTVSVHGMSLLDLCNGAVTLGKHSYSVAGAYIPGNWFDFKMEIMLESQSMDVYVNNTKINSSPVYLVADAGGHKVFDYISQFYFQLSKTSGLGVWYAKDIKISGVTDGYTETVFSESFDSATSKFTHTTTNASYNNLKLDSNQAGGGKSGVGSLYSWYKATSNSTAKKVVYVTDDTPLTKEDIIAEKNLTEFTSLSAAGYTFKEEGSTNDTDYEYFSSDSFSLAGADRAVIKFKYYHPASVRTTDTNPAGYTNSLLYFRLAGQDTLSTSNAYTAYDTRMGYNTLDHSTAKTSVTSYAGKTDFVRVKEWTDVTITVDPDAAKDFSITSNGKTATIDMGMTAEQLQGMTELDFYLRSRFGGKFYLDDVSVTKLTDKKDSWLKDSYTSYRTYECDITRENVPEIELKEVVFSDADGEYGVPVANGQVKSVTVKKNNGEISDGTKLLVAVYSGDEMTDCGVSGEIAKADLSDGSETYTFTDVEVAADSTVKVFWLNMNNLTPVLKKVSPINQQRETKIFLAGDSIVANYSQGHARTGWGQVLDNYINTNFVEIINCAISGTGAKDFAQRYVGSTDVEGSTYAEKMFNKMGADEGDYILMSFATNDGTVGDATFAEPYGTKENEGSFKYYLYENFIKPAKAKGIIPVLVTTNPKKKLSTYAVGNFYIIDGHIPYVQAMRELASETDTAIIDLYAMAVDNLNNVGAEGCAGYYVDGTHITAEGANVSAEFVARGLKLTDLEIAEFVK